MLIDVSLPFCVATRNIDCLFDVSNSLFVSTRAKAAGAENLALSPAEGYPRLPRCDSVT